MTSPNEETLVELPILSYLETLGYRAVHESIQIRSSEGDQEPTGPYRERENEVLFKPLLVQALRKLNDLELPPALAIYDDLAAVTDNQRWIKILRGDYSRRLPGEAQHRPIRLVDFEHPENNDWVVTRQLRVRGEGIRKPDVVIYLNGIPIVVIEAKSPLNPSQNSFDAIDQIRSAEREIPRLFYSNLFNIATNDTNFLFGPSGAVAESWSRWRDPWPRRADEFFDETQKGLYALLEPSRLLDILAHFIVFETREGKTTKKVCRYQQYRAVNKIVDRVLEGKHRAGLVWHTQGSGKSLTMVFAALKLKFHFGITSEKLQNPNLLVVTDRIDLHDQISMTFAACGFKNCRPIAHIRRPIGKDGQPWQPRKGADPKFFLREEISEGAVGKVLLSTVFKFEQDDPRLDSNDKHERQAALQDLEVKDSENWILMVDECHRTQEKDLGAFLGAMLPKAIRFGFTGTPVKKHDKDTFKNFGIAGERYLDKYGIEDAIADGATVPIYYQGRMTEWHLYDKEIDILFDQWFAKESEERRAELRQRGVTKGDLSRFEPRIELIAVDIWAHYRAHVLPDGFKAQVVAVNRAACVLYKKALDRAIARSLSRTEKLSREEAQERATEMSVCIYSPSQHDKEQLPEVAAWQLDKKATRQAIARFIDPTSPLRFLIVCNKLLTGFDAAIEQTMYLDNPLTDHNLLQAIARTNRRFGRAKDHGLIVDYVGISKKLADALAAYRRVDVQAAMRNLDALADGLETAHREVMLLLGPVPRSDDPKVDVEAAIHHLASEDNWYVFRAHAAAFLRAYSTLAPDPRVLLYRPDLKLVASIMPYGLMHFEQKEETHWKDYSEKIRAMLDEHLEVTGIKSVCTLRNLTDPAFWEDFEAPMNLQQAAVRKLAELKKEITDRCRSNAAQYEKFSDRIKELIEQFNEGLANAQGILDASRDLAQKVRQEDKAFQQSGLNQRAYGVSRILEKFRPAGPQLVGEPPSSYGDEHPSSPPLTPIQRVAAEIDQLYGSNESAPAYWQEKSQLRKELRGRVRRLVRPLELDHWQERIPSEVEHYAMLHYAKP